VVVDVDLICPPAHLWVPEYAETDGDLAAPASVSPSTEYSSREEFLMGRECDSCGRTYRATRSSHRYCSWTCRKGASRGALRSVVTGGAVAP